MNTNQPDPLYPQPYKMETPNQMNKPVNRSNTAEQLAQFMVDYWAANPNIGSSGELAELILKEFPLSPISSGNRYFEAVPVEKAKTVCYCGSLRVAIDAFKKAEYEAVLRGEIALLPCCMFVDIQREYGAESDYKIKADELHKRKIDICDEVMVLNVGGYVGESTRSEIAYAEKIGKPIKYLEQI